MQMLIRLRIILTKALIFVVPLFFLPFTSDFFDLNKLNLFILAVPVIALLRITESVKQGFAGIKKNVIDLLVAAYAFSALISSLMGLHTHTSIFGNFNAPGDSLLGIMSLAAFYLVISGMARDRESAKEYLDALLYAFAAVAAFSLLNLSGLFANLTASGVALEKLMFFVSGSAGALFMFAAVMLAALTGLVLFSKADDYRSKVFHLFLWLAALALLVFGQSQAAWITAIAGTLIAALFFYLDSDLAHSPGINSFIPAIMLLAVLAGYLVSEMEIIQSPGIIAEHSRPSLNLADSLAVAEKSLEEAPLAGNGPGTFALAFSRYRPESMNYEKSWNYRYERLPSQAIELAVSQGLLGASLLLALLFVFFSRQISLIKGKWGCLPAENKALIFPLLAALIASIIAQFLYENFFVMNFIFWLLFALLMFYEKKMSAKTAKSYKLIPAASEAAVSGGLRFKFFLSLTIAVFAAWSYLVVCVAGFWIADFVYSGNSGDIQAVLHAAALDPQRSAYGIRLSKLFFEKSKSELALGGEQDETVIKETVDQAVGWAQQAASANISNVAARENLGIIYRDLAPFVDNSESIAMIHFKRAEEMEPSNPVLPAEIGKLYLRMNQPENAAVSLEKALALKNDYAEAHFYLAKAYGQLGKESESLSIFSSLSQRYNDPEIFFEMARIYYNQKNIDLAGEYFSRVLQLVPGHANSLYGLGLCHESQGDSEQAVKYYSLALELNPDNEDILSRIKQLGR